MKRRVLQAVLLMIALVATGSGNLHAHPQDRDAQEVQPQLQKATFAAGCFWGVEARFRQVKGVVNTTVGYTGGFVQFPTYQMVCTGQTGHAEAVEVIFDANRVTYTDLLRVFFDCHDPTQVNRQGPDFGPQYRSAIFYHSEQQAREARDLVAQMIASRRYRGAPQRIATQLVPAGMFWAAEEYHQRYLEKRGKATCTN